MSTDPTPPAGSTVDERPREGRDGFFGQPRGLANLFSVELWERFSFYGMQGIVLLYMYFQTTDGGLGIDQTVAAGIVGAYGGSVYLFSILGGWVADRLLGSERTMFVSALLIMLGHVSLAVIPAVAGLAVGLVLIAVGSGGLKATITNLVGSLYGPQDTRRDAGFSIFYMGINIGGLVGPLLTGLVQQRWGFHLGFGLAAIGMAIGLAQYALARRNLPDTARHVPDPLPRALYGRYLAIAAAAVVLVAVSVAAGWLDAGNLGTVVVTAIVVAAVVLFVLLLTSRHVDADERSRVVAFIPMFVGSVAFWALFQQQFTVITIYSDTRLDRDFSGLPLLGDWTMPIPWVQSFNPFFIILLAPLFAALWVRLGDRQPTTPVKFALGISLMGAAFLVFLPMVGTAGVPVLWVAMIMLVATAGELMLSPVGLSLSTKLAPKAYPVLMVSLFYLSLALGTALSGTLAGFYSEEREAAYFGTLGAVTIGIGLVLLALSPWITRKMRGVR
ncbi:oligopeptide:H+ symporter [Ornithinimicrobium humiphilum]|uniref:POT family proton-dependent oligopeptide transporter n=1 Tax=Ornithinimicrobium humiphilum TaxID=125288 RepID=A0A543KNV8_9MICO|nr:peptide MFS transporter [Ornithinimicrobium humiphilum]TQM96756.1 POT family proton-dependent oligopeptide transporter [Ornithinimicrobium humiphilum]